MIKAASLIGAGLVLGGIFMPLECTFSIGPVCLQRQSLMSLAVAAVNLDIDERERSHLPPTPSEMLTQNNPAVSREAAIINSGASQDVGYTTAFLNCHRDVQCYRAACEAAVELGYFDSYALCDPDKQ